MLHLNSVKLELCHMLCVKRWKPSWIGWWQKVLSSQWSIQTGWPQLWQLSKVIGRELEYAGLQSNHQSSVPASSLPSAEDRRHNIICHTGGWKVFTKPGLPATEYGAESQKYLVINMLKGLFHYTKLHSAYLQPQEFSRKQWRPTLLQGIPHVTV